MKNFILFLLLMLLSIRYASAQPKPQDSDTLWTKWIGVDITKVQFTPDGNSIAVAGGSSVRIYDIHTGNLVKTFSGYGIVKIQDFVFSPDGKKLITSNATSTLYNMIVWDYDKVDTLVSFNNSLIFMKFINNEQILGSTGRGFHIVDSNGNTSKEDSANGNVYAFAVSPTNNYFAVGAEQDYDPKFYNVELWDLNSFKKIVQLGTHNTTFADFTFSPDGKYLATSSRDGVIKIWDMNSKTLVKTISHSSIIMVGGNLNIIYSPTNNFFVSSGGGGNLSTFSTKIWDSNTFNLIYQYSNPLYAATYGLDISKDTSFIVLGCGSMLILLKAHWTPTKIVDNPNEIKIIFPNPVGNEITIPLESSLITKSIKFININGLTIKKILNIEPYIGTVQIDISMLQIGTYFVNINYNNKIITYKFAKER